MRPLDNADYAHGNSSTVHDSDVHMRGGRRLESLAYISTVGRRCGAMRASLKGWPRAQMEGEISEAVLANAYLRVVFHVEHGDARRPVVGSFVTSPPRLEVFD
jgi:hypothetical protein